MTITEATANDAGCWIDGAWGHYGVSRLVEIAHDYGFPLDAEDEATLAMHVSEDTGDAIIWLADKAEEWMNDYVAPPEYSFGWHDGEFFLLSIKEWQGADTLQDLLDSGLTTSLPTCIVSTSTNEQRSTT